jgi:NDP-sugar pyrophosphorylase family protein
MNTSMAIVLNSLIEPERLALKPSAEKGRLDILDRKTNCVLGSLVQPENASHSVELFFGKGGFMGMVSSPKGVRYFALPGSSLCVGGTSLVLQGNAITSNPTKKRAIAPVGEIKAQPHSHQATILGAGLATRFERISGDSTHFSKPAVPLAGNRSVIECLANGLTQHGFDQIIVNTFFKPESLKASLSRCKGAKIRYIDEAEPSGTAGGLRKMLTDSHFKDLLDLNQPLLVVQGDSVTDVSFSALMEAHVANRALVTIGCQMVDEKDVDKFGIIVTDQSGPDGQSGKITGFQEKPKQEDAKSLLGNTGFYIFSPQSFPVVKAAYEQLLTGAQASARKAGQPIPDEIPIDFANDVFPAVLEWSQQRPDLGCFWSQVVDGYWSDIGNPVQYLETIHDLYEGKVNIPLPPNPQHYYRDGVLFWEGAFDLAAQESTFLSGNVVVATPFTG